MTILGILAQPSVPAIPTTPVAGYKLWLDAADTSSITASGGDVSQWDDKSGYNSDFTQSSATSKPKTGTRTINSLNTIDFDGTNDFLVCPSSTALFNYLHTELNATVFFVGIVDNTVDSKTVFNNNNGSSSNVGIRFDITDIEKDLCQITRAASGSPLVNSSDNVTYTTGVAYQTAIKIKLDTATAADRYKISLNSGAFAGANTQNIAAIVANATDNMRIGIISDDVSLPYNGCIGEILFYEGVLSNANIIENQAYLANKWGL